MAGTGTILAEAAAWTSEARLLGNDIDAAAIGVAAGRLPSAELRACRYSDMDLEPATLTLTVSNPPWDMQFSSDMEQIDLFEEVIRKSLDHAAPSWRGVFLTPHGRTVEKAAQRLGSLTVEKAATVTVRGTKAFVMRVSPRAPAPDPASQIEDPATP